MSDPAKVVPLKRRAEGEFPGTLLPIGAIFDPELSFDQWANAGQILTTMYDGSCWATGDWLITGRARFGETYGQALPGFSPQTLEDYRRVCETFPMPRRRPDSRRLRFGHFRAVYKLPEAEQEELLDLCEKQDWNREQLRAEKRRRREEREPTIPGATEPREPEPAQPIELKPGDRLEIKEGPQRGLYVVRDPEPEPEIEPVEPEDYTFGEPEELGEEAVTFTASSEPAPSSPEDAAAFLKNVAQAMPANIGGAILVLVLEYERLGEIARVARQSVGLGYITPTLRAIVNEQTASA